MASAVHCSLVSDKARYNKPITILVRIVQIKKLANDTTAVINKAVCFSFSSLSGFGEKNGAFKCLNTDLIADKGFERN